MKNSEPIVIELGNINSDSTNVRLDNAIDEEIESGNLEAVLREAVKIPRLKTTFIGNKILSENTVTDYLWIDGDTSMVCDVCIIDDVQWQCVFWRTNGSGYFMSEDRTIFFTNQ